MKTHDIQHFFLLFTATLTNMTSSCRHDELAAPRSWSMLTVTSSSVVWQAIHRVCDVAIGGKYEAKPCFTAWNRRSKKFA